MRQLSQMHSHHTLCTGRAVSVGFVYTWPASPPCGAYVLHVLKVGGVLAVLFYVVCLAIFQIIVFEILYSITLADFQRFKSVVMSLVVISLAQVVRLGQSAHRDFAGSFPWNQSHFF